MPQVLNPGPIKWPEAFGTNPGMQRASMVDWMTHAANERGLSAPVLFAGISLMDRYVIVRGRAGLMDPLAKDGPSNGSSGSGSSSGSRGSTISDIAPMLLAFLTLAAKSVSPRSLPPLVRFVQGTSATAQQVADAELAVLHALDFRVCGIVTTRDVLDVFLARERDAVDADTAALARYLAQLTLLEHALLPFKPSQLAAACLMQAELLMASRVADERSNNSAGADDTMLKRADPRRALLGSDPAVQKAMAHLLSVQQVVAAALFNGRPYAATVRHLSRLV
jgi:hypothetical protein